MASTANQDSSSDILTWLLRLEDRDLVGKTVDLGDGAGLTRFGITSKDDSGKVSADFFTCPTDQAIAAAKAFYQTQFWDKLNCDKTLPYGASVLSAAVNVGIEPAEEWASRNRTIDAFIARWIVHYEWVARTRPQDAKFLDGWLKRARAVYPNLPD